jgi:hypothetical protein
MSAAAILKLQASGFSAEQVSALAELLDTQVATKADVEASEHRLELKISDVKAELEAREHRLELKIGNLKTDLELKIGNLKTDLELKIGNLKTDLELKIGNLKTDLELKISDLKGELHLQKWMLGFVLAFQLAIFAKLFLH